MRLGLELIKQADELARMAYPDTLLGNLGRAVYESAVINLPNLQELGSGAFLWGLIRPIWGIQAALKLPFVMIPATLAHRKFEAARELERKLARPLIEEKAEKLRLLARRNWDRYLVGQTHRGKFFRPLIRRSLAYRRKLPPERLETLVGARF